jgi:hypothetical protein
VLFRGLESSVLPAETTVRLRRHDLARTVSNGWPARQYRLRKDSSPSFATCASDHPASSVGALHIDRLVFAAEASLE